MTMQNEKSPCANTGNPNNLYSNPTQNGHFKQGYDAEKIRNSARGQWPTILPALGMDQKFLSNKHGPCPFCGGKDRFRFDDKDGNGTYICGPCGPGNGFSLVAKILGLDLKRDFPRILEIVAEMVGYMPNHALPTREGSFSVDLSPFLARQKDKADFIPPGVEQSHPGGQEPLNPAGQTDKAAQTAEKARLILAETTPAQYDFPYLVEKCIKTHGLRTYSGSLVIAGMACDGALVLPLQDETGKIQTLQFINENGEKRFLPGGTKKGAFCTIGEFTETIVFAEGFATAASIYEATGLQVIITVDSGNIKPVVEKFRRTYPQGKFIIAGDDDWRTSGNPGLSKATEAAKVYGCQVAIADFGPDRQETATDFNDLHRDKGFDVVKQQILAARQPDAEPQGANDEPRRSFYLTIANDLLGEPATTQWLIPKMLPTNCLAMLIGDPAAGKSFLALHWAALIASVSGPAAYIAGEGYHGIKKRLKGWFTYHGVSSENVPLFVSSTGTSFDTGEGLADVELALDKVSKEYGNPKLIIIDTLHRNMQGDENSSQDVGLVIKAADQIRVRYGAAVIIVHHSGHTDKSRGRGSSSLRAAVDVELLLSVKGGVRTLGCSKMKDSEPFQPSDYELKSVILPWTDESGNFETSAIILPTGETPKTWTSQENAPKVKKQSSAETLGLSTLKDAMGNTSTVTLEAWRECFYRRHHGDSQPAKQKAFLRVRENLTSKGLITVENDLYSFKESELDTGTTRTYGTNVPPLSRLSGRDMRDTPDKILKDCLVSRPGVPLGAVSGEHDDTESEDNNSFASGGNQTPDHEDF
ncbi:MAG TPA: AAA family ATPase [Magnetococcales bacterium]|nr:AAA family ATPase [Magnetococcales bacterium]